MKFRVGDSTADAGSSIPAKMKMIVALAMLSLALLAMPGQAFAEGTKGSDAEGTEGSEYAAPDPTTDPTAAQYAGPTEVLPPAVTVPQIPAPPEKPTEKPVEQIQAGLGAGGGQPAERVAVPVADNGPSLPFTGLDVAALAAVALALTGTGVVLRRLATMGDAQK